METLNNPQNIQTILHKTHGKIVLEDNQQFQAWYKDNSDLKKIEIWETRNNLLYHVATFRGKSVLMINV